MDRFRVSAETSGYPAETFPSGRGLYLEGLGGGRVIFPIDYVGLCEK